MPPESSSATGGFSLASFGRRLGALDRVLFTRQLATLIAAGLPIEEALQAIAQQTEKQSMRSLVMAIRSKLLEGHSLAGSLADYPGSFSHLYRSTIAAGEQSGFLDKVLDNLADLRGAPVRVQPRRGDGHAISGAADAVSPSASSAR